MYNLFELYKIFWTDITNITIIFFINFILLIIFKFYLTKKFEIKNIYQWIYFLLLTIFFILTSIIFSRDYAGLQNGFKELILVAIIFLILLFNGLVIFEGIYITKEQSKKAIAFLLIIWFLLFLPTSIIIEGAFQAEDEFRNWDSMNNNFETNSTKFNITMQLDTQAIALKGFFAKIPLLLGIYDGYVKDNENNLSENDTITIGVSLSHHPFYPENGTMLSFLRTYEFEYYSNHKFILKEEDKGDAWLIAYSYSGDKYMLIDMYVNGDLKTSFKKLVVPVEKGYVKAQVEMSRFMIVFAIWAIFASLYRPLDKIVNWWIH